MRNPEIGVEAVQDREGNKDSTFKDVGNDPHFPKIFDSKRLYRSFKRLVPSKPIPVFAPTHIEKIPKNLCTLVPMQQYMAFL
ncbi:MAG: hypothetical protein C5S48_01820 [Candidatus Methanogaster sp.]|nr:MAG: hypothetical protein C5S48_01820 [ANME-2 cluster archaeon]